MSRGRWDTSSSDGDDLEAAIKATWASIPALQCHSMLKEDQLSTNSIDVNIISWHHFDWSDVIFSSSEILFGFSLSVCKFALKKKKVPVQILVGSFLCGICIFSQWIPGFVFAHSSFLLMSKNMLHKLSLWCLCACTLLLPWSVGIGSSNPHVSLQEKVGIKKLINYL